MRIDFHTHSTASDGSDTPLELLLQADVAGLTHIAMTDHDTLFGVRSAMQNRPPSNLKFLAGIELSCSGFPGKCHILGLGIDPFCATFEENLSLVQAGRLERNTLIASRLTQLGIECHLADVAKYAHDDGVIGRPHFAQWLIDSGHCRDMNHAFKAYLGDNAKAYMPVDTLSPEEGIRIIQAAGGKAYIAHPMLLRLKSQETIEQRIRLLKDYGLDGMEVFYPEHTPFQTEMLMRLATKYELMMTGGSDYHGRHRPNNHLGRVTDGLPVPVAFIDPFLLESAT